MNSAPAVKSALVALMNALWDAPTLVTYGAPGSYLPDEIVAVMGQRIEVTRPTMGTNRSREETVETDVTFSVFMPGADEAQRDATERAYTMALQLDERLRSAPNEALSGACRDAWTVRGELVESRYTSSPGGGSVSGRLAELTVVVVTVARR